MFYLKYRPATVTGLDNTPVKETLANILSAQSIPHAMLFVGQKGMGKTSTARIVAKAVNCRANRFAELNTDATVGQKTGSTNPTPSAADTQKRESAGSKSSYEPCNTCDNCISISKGNSPDVIEMDAASNRGIEEVKNLIRDAVFAPMLSRYKVFIIDEAHMITPDGFNALLKTLEEPPEHVVFILATTNEEKVPQTIISRCTRVNFGRASTEDITAMIIRIARAESVTITPETMRIIADAADYSFRDAAKIFEDLIAQDKLAPDTARKYLGSRSKTALLSILENGSVDEAIQWLSDFTEGGGSGKLLIEDMLKGLQELLKTRSLAGKTYAFTPRQIAGLMRLFTEAYGLLRVSPVEGIPLEIAVVDYFGKYRTKTV